MEAKELRIGNFIEIGINPEYKSTIGTVTEISNWIRCDYETGGVIVIAFNDAKPIPLTEEWLLKFGFRKNISSEELIYFLPIPNLKCELQAALYMGEFVIEIHNHLMPIIPEVEFVHQLQNLYFALTQNELTIK